MASEKWLSRFIVASLAIAISTGVTQARAGECGAKVSADEWAAKAGAEECKAKTADGAFAGQSPGHRFLTFMAGGLGLGGEGGLTNNTGTKLEPGAATPAKFDDDEWVYKASIGWNEKQVARDFYLMFWGTSTAALDEYRTWGEKNLARRWAGLDALKLDASYSYGSTITKADDADDFTVDTRGTYEVKLVYRVPLENACQALGLCAPFREE